MYAVKYHPSIVHLLQCILTFVHPSVMQGIDLPADMVCEALSNSAIPETNDVSLSLFVRCAHLDHLSAALGRYFFAID